MKRPSLIIAFLMAAFTAGRAQEPKNTTMESLLEKSQKAGEGSSLLLSSPLDAPVNPSTYRVGPGDVFAINIWLSPPVSFAITVTPEGTLIVPTIGEIKVGDLVLAEARKMLLEAIRRKYISQSPTVTLLKARSVVVFVRGSVAVAGRYVLNASDRVERAIRFANGEGDLPAASLKPGEEMERRRILQEYFDRMSQRTIVLRRRDGTVAQVDLVKYHATGDDRWNPSLAEGDEVIVPRLDGNQNSFGVYGGVNLPGRFEYIEGETLKDALLIARGFSTRAIRDSVILLRENERSTGFSRTVFSFASAQAEQEASGIKLVPGDRLVVQERRELRGDDHVSIEGEVPKPGWYPITRENTRLSEVIAMAGGFTGNALLSGSEIRRLPSSGRWRERQLEALSSAGGVNAIEDTMYFRSENLLRMEQERVKVDIEGLILRGDSSQNIFLRDGDRIIIASGRKTVYVFGQVISPGHVPYLPGSTVSHYISLAGGYTGEARSGDVRVVKYSTKQWLDPGETTVEEGDAIWVPKTVEQPFAYYAGIIGQIASVISVVLSMTIIIIQLNK